MRIGTREALNARREQAKAWLAAEQRVILVCAGTGCIAGGAMKVYDKLQELCLERKLKTRVALREEGGKDTLHFKRSGCQGFCEMGPLIEIQPEGIFYTHVHPEDCEEILEKTILHGEVIERLLYKLADTTYVKHDDIPFYKKQKRVVLETSGNTDAEDLDEYLAHDGYAALEKALFDMTPAEICSGGCRLRSARQRRRRLPDRQEVEKASAGCLRARNTSSATATKATPARSWTSPSWRAIPTRFSRA